MASEYGKIHIDTPPPPTPLPEHLNYGAAPDLSTIALASPTLTPLTSPPPPPLIESDYGALPSQAQMNATERSVEPSHEPLTSAQLEAKLTAASAKLNLGDAGGALDILNESLAAVQAHPFDPDAADTISRLRYAQALALAATNRQVAALAALQAAVALGLTDFAKIRRDPGLKSVRKLPAYVQWMLEAEAAPPAGAASAGSSDASRRPKGASSASSSPSASASTSGGGGFGTLKRLRRKVKSGKQETAAAAGSRAAAAVAAPPAPKVKPIVTFVDTTTSTPSAATAFDGGDTTEGLRLLNQHREALVDRLAKEVKAKAGTESLAAQYRDPKFLEPITAEIAQMAENIVEMEAGLARLDDTIAHYQGGVGGDVAAGGEARGGWVELATDEGVPYYYHEESDTTQWEVPAEWAGIRAPPPPPPPPAEGEHDAGDDAGEWGEGDGEEQEYAAEAEPESAVPEVVAPPPANASAGVYGGLPPPATMYSMLPPDNPEPVPPPTDVAPKPTKPSRPTKPARPSTSGGGGSGGSGGSGMTRARSSRRKKQAATAGPFGTGSSGSAGGMRGGGKKVMGPPAHLTDGAGAPPPPPAADGDTLARSSSSRRKKGKDGMARAPSSRRRKKMAAVQLPPPPALARVPGVGAPHGAVLPPPPTGLPPPPTAGNIVLPPPPPPPRA